MVEIACKTKRYPSDLTDKEWEQIKRLLEKSLQVPATLHRPAIEPHVTELTMSRGDRNV
jgi:hypothetical protein